MSWKGAALLSAALAAVPCAGASAQELALDWSERLSPGQTLEVRGITGDIRAVLAEGETATVRATKDGRESDFDDVDVRIRRDADGVAICVVYFDRADPDDPCDWHSDGRDHRGRRNLRVSVDFEVAVPAGVDLVAATVSGDVDAEGLRAYVRGSSVSGDVTISTTGVASASTVSGRLDVEMGSTAWDDLDFSTVSGDITLYMPADLETDVSFESLSGDLRSDFDIVVERHRRRFVGQRLRGRIGEGGDRELTLHTVSGDVSLYRLRR